MEDRFAQISHEFNENRDLYYRKQLQSFQVDIDFIRNAALYVDKPLDEFGDEGTEEATTSAAASTQGSVRNVNLNGDARHGLHLKNGAYAAKFAHKINDALEQRDADLTNVAVFLPPRRSAPSLCPL